MSDVNQSRDLFEKLHALWSKLSRPVRVLLVEDNHHDIELILKVLQGYRVEITVALTGSEAVQQLANAEYDLCLLDLRLTDLDGADVVRLAKERNRAVPFIVLTGLNDSSPMIKQALDAGVECVIQKPLSEENAKMILGGL